MYYEYEFNSFGLSSGELLQLSAAQSNCLIYVNVYEGDKIGK